MSKQPVFLGNRRSPQTLTTNERWNDEVLCLPQWNTAAKSGDEMRELFRKGIWAPLITRRLWNEMCEKSLIIARNQCHLLGYRYAMLRKKRQSGGSMTSFKSEESRGTRTAA